MTKIVRMIGGLISIVGGVLLVIIGAVIIPLHDSLGIFNLETAISLMCGLGIGAILGGIILIMDKLGGAGLSLGGALMTICVFALSSFSDAPVENPPSLWFIVGPGLAALGGFLGLLTKTEFKVIKREDNTIEDTLNSVEGTLFNEFNVLKIKYFGHYFGKLLFLTEFKDGKDSRKFDLIPYLENALNQKVILALKMIPDSTILKDNMYYLIRGKHGTFKTNRKAITFIG